MSKFQKGNPGGPGRPRKAEQYARPIVRAEKQIVDKLPTLLENMLLLANGGYERIEEQWVPAGNLFVGSGEFLRSMYPDRDPTELILVKRTVSIADKDRAANEYLINRIMGKPTERQELTGANGGLLALAREVIIEVPADESVDTTDPDDL